MKKRDDCKSSEQVGGDSSSHEPNQEPANMAPVLTMLNTWGAETPFAQISESAVGGSVLAVSFIPCFHFVNFFSSIVCVRSTDGNSRSWA